MSLVPLQAAEVLGNLRADDRGFISGLCVKAALLDLAPALRMSDLEVREILYQLDKTACGISYFLCRTSVVYTDSLWLLLSYS